MATKKSKAVTEAPKRRRAPKAKPEPVTLSREELDAICNELREEENVREQDFLRIDFLFALAGELDKTATAMIFEGHMNSYDAAPSPDELRSAAKYFLKRLGHAQ